VVTQPYYADDLVTLYLGDCREVTAWLEADVLVTDPPYGIGWTRGDWAAAASNPHKGGIASDDDTGIRDAALASWGGERPALVFGSLRAAYPAGWKRMLVFRKPVVACGLFGNRMPWLTNWEPVFALGKWPQQTPKLDAVIATAEKAAAGWSGYVTRYKHPHAKPVDAMETLISACPDGTVADPFAGSGSILVAARNLGRSAVGVELEERYCEQAARRLSQMALGFPA
jgi:site-specific DNA-methyltransferase (adenine-specific)